MTRIDRREFLSRFLGNTFLAAGGSLLGAAVAYEIYRNRSLDSLSKLKAGAPVLPPQAAQAQPTLASVQAQTAVNPPTTAAAAPPPPPANGEEPAIFAAATPAQLAQDTPPGLIPVKLSIESIGLINAKVVQIGTKIENGVLVWDTADHAVGWQIGTGLPGRPGNVVLAGHISSPVRGQGNIFHSLPNLANKIGSRAQIQTADGSWFVYTVTGTDVVEPSAVQVMDPTPTPTLTLLTCVPDGVYTHRFVARGAFTGRA